MDNWKKFYGKKVRLIVEDTDHPKSKDGILNSVDSTHIWLYVEKLNPIKMVYEKELVPFSRTSVKRMEVKE